MRLGILAVIGVLVAASLLVVPPTAAPNASLILAVGDKAEMRTRNVLNVSLSASLDGDLGVGILQPVYSNPLVRHPSLDELRPYVAKGVDADGNGTFEADEYGVFQKAPGTNLSDVTVYFDFNGVLWHDAVQMDVMDLLFSLEVASLVPRYGAPLRPLWDLGGSTGSNFSTNRWLAVARAPKAWAGEGAIPGQSALRVAIRFRLQVPYARFYDSTLGGLWLLPRHIWEGTGGGRHADFGRAVYPEGDPRAGQGIPATETLYKPFDVAAALAWEPRDADVIGAGPFRFTEWRAGQYEQLNRYDAYYVGRDPANPDVAYDSRLSAYVHLPFVQEIVFHVYRTPQLGVLALEDGEIDYFRANVPPEFVPDLLNMPRIRVWANAGPGLTYVAYNMRRLPFGYAMYPPANATRDDTGLPFRLAFGHLIDKVTIVRSLLQNYGVVADGFMSPASTFWYNSSIPSYTYDPALAASILDNAGWTVGPNGWRVFPGLGDAQFKILTPQADFDPIRASASAMIVTAAQSINISVVMAPMAFGRIINAVDARDFDMAILGWRLDSTEPDYMYSFFHCDGEIPSLNVPSYCDPEFDRVIERSRTEMDLVERQRLVRWAQGILAEDRPVEPLYAPTVIEAQRSDRLVNWSVRAGTLWNYWSWIGVRPPEVPPWIRPILTCPSAIASGARESVEVSARDSDHDPLTGAHVTMQIVPDTAGSFVESSGAEVSGNTGPSGNFTATYQTPVAAPPFEDVTIVAVVEHWALTTPYVSSCTITVFPPNARFLSLRISLPAGDITFAGTPVPLRVEVSDESGLPATDASVNATVFPANAILSRSSGTAAEMATLYLSPPPHLGANQEYRVSLDATKAGYSPAHANVSLLVVPGTWNPPPPPSDDLGFRVAAIALLVTAVIIVVWVLHRKKRSKP